MKLSSLGLLLLLTAAAMTQLIEISRPPSHVAGLDGPAPPGVY